MQKKKLIVSLLLVTLILAAALYSWPRSLESALPGFSGEGDFTDCYAVVLSADPEHEPSVQPVSIALDCPAYTQLMELLGTASYVRSPSDLFRLGRASDTQAITLSPYYATIYLRQGDALYSISLYGPHVVTTVNSPQAYASETYLMQGGKGAQTAVIEFLLTEAQSD
ncbi:MAG: hypothetical protein AAGU02_07345 [Lawsonibacter sp.]